MTAPLLCNVACDLSANPDLFGLLRLRLTEMRLSAALSIGTGLSTDCHLTVKTAH